jgi:NAD-dependent SIR2 family protein deacetylase
VPLNLHQLYNLSEGNASRSHHHTIATSIICKILPTNLKCRYLQFHVPSCKTCGTLSLDSTMDMNREESILKPNVVFFGDTVPRASAQEATKKVISSHTHTHTHTCFGFRSSSLVKFIA